MTNSHNPTATEKQSSGFSRGQKWEAAGIAALVLVTAYLLKVSWRKWADPIVDSGTQWYAFWRLSQGATLYHDILWNYGPLSAYFNAAIFRIFGPGMMVLAAVNLVIYAGIVTLAYLAFRRAWGRLAAFAATAVFICGFSFLHLSAVGNYNYVLPYAHEATHGMLVILLAVFAAARWVRGPSPGAAFMLGLCGGLTAVLKPEFMLAGGVLGMAALGLRCAERKRVTAAEFGMLAAGLVLPTMLFAAWFARLEPLGNAFIDASRAWWMVLVDHSQLSHQQGKFAGLGDAGANILFELKAAGKALVSAALIWAAGWCVNRSGKLVVRGAVVAAAMVSLWYLPPIGGWYSIGRCFPILVAVVAVMLAARAIRELRTARKLEENTAMALLLVLVAGTMLARMPLFPRIYHLGFFQAALAGMILAAVLVAELPRWTGTGPGRCVATGGVLAALAMGCVAIAGKSTAIYGDETQVVGTGRDRFYAFAPDIDATGALVNWTVEQLRGLPPRATVFALPEGLMVNYLSRRTSPLPTWNGVVPEKTYVSWLQASPPDYVIVISRDLSEFNSERFGYEGNAGYEIMKWVLANYKLETRIGGDPLDPKAAKGVAILKRK